MCIYIVVRRVSGGVEVIDCASNSVELRLDSVVMRVLVLRSHASHGEHGSDLKSGFNALVLQI